MHFPLRARAASAAAVACLLMLFAAGCEPTAEPPPPCADFPAAAFATEVVSFAPGAGAGFGQAGLPDVVLGPPRTPGAPNASLDVLSLGVGGEIVLGFSQRIVDGEGPDFIVFENAFAVPRAKKVYTEPGEVAVSGDGVTWAVYPCEPGVEGAAMCAGMSPSAGGTLTCISATDPEVAGGDAFDLRVLGVAEARFVRIRSRADTVAAPSAGFDLDAVAIVNGAEVTEPSIPTNE